MLGKNSLNILSEQFSDILILLLRFKLDINMKNILMKYFEFDLWLEYIKVINAYGTGEVYSPTCNKFVKLILGI